MKIGIFDSGVGGLTVLKSLSEKYNAEYIYIGDNKNCPYGEKTKDELLTFAVRIVNYFIKQGISIIVIACNTCCANVLDDLRVMYKEITFIGVIESTINRFIKLNKNNVLVIGTNATIKTNIYETKLKEKNNNLVVTSLATPLLVPLIEDGIDVKKVLDNYLEPYKDIDSIILGCTHYKLIEDKIDRNITIVNSSDCVVDNIKDFIIPVDKLKITIYTTGDKCKFSKLSTRIIGLKAKHIDI